MDAERFGNRFGCDEKPLAMIARPYRGSLSFARRSKDRSRKGFVLAAALLATLVIAALVSGIFFAATEETRIGAASAERQLALSAAESGIEETIAGWDAGGTDTIAIGASRSSSLDGLGAAVAVRVTRLDSTIYWIVAYTVGRESGAGVTRRIGVIVSARTGLNRSTTIGRIPERSWSELF